MPIKAGTDFAMQMNAQAAGPGAALVWGRRRFLGLCAGFAAVGAVGPTFAQSSRTRPPNPAQIELLINALNDAESHGFGEDEFGQSAAIDAIEGADPAGPGLLRAAIFAYARAQRGQRLPLSAFPDEWAVRPPIYNPAPGFDSALAGDTLAAWLTGLPPPYEGYEALRTALAHYRDMAGRHGWKAIAEGPPLGLGAEDPRVAALRRRLTLEDPTTPSGDETPNVFDAPLQEAVVRFQRRYGMAPDGVVGPPTLAALNAPVGQRVQQIKANMERWRWLPRSLPPSRIQVNIAAAVMAVYQDNQPVLAMKAVAGRPDDATPMLKSVVESIVLNPAWHVPSTIAEKELLPKERRNPGYFARNDYVVSRDENGAVHIVQKAGAKSALGHFKFDFANPFGVYLHDTPAHSGFARTSRLASHGCVRLEQPKALAELLLQGDETWTPERIDEVVQAGDETLRARLQHPIPVFILYWTAFGDSTGGVQFRPDAYDWDRKLLTLLADQTAAA